MSIQYSHALKELYEMFPQHNRDVIKQVLERNHRSLENTINTLLSMSPTKVPSNTSKGTANSTIKSKKNSNHASPPQDHIFPEDFLRFPPHVEYVQVDADNGLEGTSPLQTTQDVAFKSSNSSLQSADLLNSLSQSDFNTSDSWNTMKSYFMSNKESGYNQI